VITNHAFQPDRDGRCGLMYGTGGDRERCGNARDQHAAEVVDEREKKDNLYLKLHGARERLCVAQMLVPDNYKPCLELAINQIDRCGAELVPEVWSRFDRTHEGY